MLLCLRVFRVEFHVEPLFERNPKLQRVYRIKTKPRSKKRLGIHDVLRRNVLKLKRRNDALFDLLFQFVHSSCRIIPEIKYIFHIMWANRVKSAERRVARLPFCPICSTLEERFGTAEPKDGEHNMATIIVDDSENLERAIKRFKRMVEKEGIVREFKKREYYVKPSATLHQKRTTLERKLLNKKRKSERKDY